MPGFVSSQVDAVGSTYTDEINFRASRGRYLLPRRAHLLPHGLIPRRARSTKRHVQGYLA